MMGACIVTHRYHRSVSDPATGPLALIQSFVSTLGPESDAVEAPEAADASDSAGSAGAGGSDPLGSRAEAASWLHAAGLLPAEAGLTNSEHSALLRMREALRDVIVAHAEGHADEAATERLTKALAEGRLVVIVEPAGTVRLASAARTSYPGLVAAVAVAFADMVAAGTWPQLEA
jgi:hypothetical protein